MHITGKPTPDFAPHKGALVELIYNGEISVVECAFCDDWDGNVRFWGIDGQVIILLRDGSGNCGNGYHGPISPFTWKILQNTKEK